MVKIFDIFIPKETVSDDNYKVTGVYFKDGDKVNKSDIIGSFETSKADIELESPEDGYIFYNVLKNDKIQVNEIFACVSKDQMIPDDYFDTKAIMFKSALYDNKEEIPDNQKISKPALELIQKYGLKVSDFSGYAIVTKKDVEEIGKKKGFKIAGSSLFVTVKQVSDKNKIVIVGGGNHTGVCIDVLRLMNQYDIVGIVFTKSRPTYPDIMGIPILGDLEKLKIIYKDIAKNAVVGIGGLDDSSLRAKLYDELNSIGYNIPNIIHPSAIIEPSARIGEGNQILAGVYIGSKASIGNNCILNTYSIVSHDCIINDNAMISPGAILGGTVKVDKNSIIGMGVTVYYGCTIGPDKIIKNGDNIFKDFL